MKLLAVRMARCVWLLPQYFLNPRGVYLRPARQMIKERYGFLVAPSDQDINTSPEGIKFADGSFNNGSKTIQVSSMILHADGIVVDTRSTTDDSDAFLDDALGFLCTEFGLPSYKDLPSKRTYASELNVIFDKEPTLLNQRLSPFLEQLSSAIGSEEAGKPGFIGLTYGPDQSRSDKPGFRFEREIRTPFSERRFYSFAPIPTEKHLKLLQTLEELS